MLNLSRPHRWIASFSFVAALLLSLGKADFAPVEPQAAWIHPTVRVCWASQQFIRDLIASGKINQVDEHMAKLMRRVIDSNAGADPTTDEKSNIENTIVREYNSRGTGIRFVGWKSCEEDAERSQAYLFTGTDASSAVGINGQSSIGQCADDNTRYIFPFTWESGYHRETGQKAAVFLRLHRKSKKKINPFESDAITALHEFGHLAGLRHEHLRMESKWDPICKLTGDTWMTEKADETTQLVGRYDPQSVMNYCWVHLLRDSHGTEFLISDYPEKWPMVYRGSKLARSQVWFNDLTVFHTAPASYQELKGTSYTARIALSALDVKSLRCLYLASYYCY